jgi:tripartite-type tricarboxylate transporter receptor subunit TctC
MSLPTLLNRRHTLTVLGGSLAAPLILKGAASAQEAWPARTVRYINAFPAGGATDTLSRIFCQKMTEISGQSFVVENKVGAGGVIGADAVAKSSPDGYTLGLGGIANNVLAIGAYAKLPYDAAKDFTFISGIWRLPNLLSARKDIPTTDVKELIALFKKEPNKWTYASGGIGTTPHLSGEMFNSMAGVQVTHVPYKGGAPAMIDLLGGRVDLLFDNLPGVLPNVRAGLVKPVAVTNPTRVPELPDVPAMAEILPGYQLTSWIALIGPAGMPADLVSKINALSVKALTDPGLKARYNDLGATPMPMTVAEITAFRTGEEARLLPIMKAAGIRPE